MRLLALVSILMASCASTTVTRIGENEYGAYDPSDVEVFSGESEVPAPYDRVGLIEVKNPGGLSDEGEVMRRGVAQAADLGANGLLLVGGIPADARKIQMVAIRVHYDQSELRRAFTSRGNDVKRLQVEGFDSWADREAPEQPVDPERVAAATELARGLIFPAHEADVEYNRSTRVLSVRFTTPDDYEIDYDDAYSRLRNNQWVALQQFDAQEVPVEQVVVETNDLDGRGYLRASGAAEDVRKLARLPSDAPWRSKVRTFVRGTPSGDWVALSR